MKLIGEHCQVAVSDDVLYEQLEDEIVLLDMRAGTYFGLSPVAAQLWRALADGRTVLEARVDLLEMFDVQPETLDIDLNTLIDSLLDKQLISLKTVPSLRR